MLWFNIKEWTPSQWTRTNGLINNVNAYFEACKTIDEEHNEEQEEEEEETANKNSNCPDAYNSQRGSENNNFSTQTAPEMTETKNL